MGLASDYIAATTYAATTYAATTATNYNIAATTYGSHYISQLHTAVQGGLLRYHAKPGRASDQDVDRTITSP